MKKSNIVNILSNKPLKIYDIVKYFGEKKINIKLIRMHKADLKDAHEDNNKLKKTINNFTISNFL